MNKELQSILKLMNEKINTRTLRQIKKIAEETKIEKYINKIEEDKEMNRPAEFRLGSKTIKVNYEFIKNYLYRFEEAMRTDIPNATKEEMQLIKLLTVYRMFLHEFYHSKQIYNAFDTDKNDIETEITRSIFNINREQILEELKIIKRSEMIEYRTALINKILLPYDEINPLERKAEIQSLFQIRQLLEPIRNTYPKIYDEIYCMEMVKATAGYDKATIPYFKTLEILNKMHPDFEISLPYKSENELEFLKKANEMTTERQRIELGLNVKQYTLQNINDEITKILYKKY